MCVCVFRQPSFFFLFLLLPLILRPPIIIIIIIIQVMDLEARLDQAQEDLKSGVRPGRERNGAGGSDRILPRAPAKAVLAGHRNPVTCVALHPLYSVVASSSEDATVKVTNHFFFFYSY